MKPEDLENIKMYQAVKELDRRLKEQNVKPFELDVVGGFAMLMNGTRTNRDSYTDIDYVGPELSEIIMKTAEKVADDLNLTEPDWVNNYVSYEGAGKEDIELSTGPLNFEKMEDNNLSVIKLNVLDEESLLRMKLVALDTGFMEFDDGNIKNFDRIKDLNDIRLLMGRLDYEDVYEVKDLMAGYVVEPNIYYIVDYYNKTQDHELNNIDKLRRIIKDGEKNDPDLGKPYADDSLIFGSDTQGIFSQGNADQDPDKMLSALFSKNGGMFRDLFKDIPAAEKKAENDNKSIKQAMPPVTSKANTGHAEL
jgi:hypothetical protein